MSCLVAGSKRRLFRSVVPFRFSQGKFQAQLGRSVGEESMTPKPACTGVGRSFGSHAFSSSGLKPLDTKSSIPARRSVSLQHWTMSH